MSLSIVIPVFGVTTHLPDALGSIIRSWPGEAQVVIVDDGNVVPVSVALGETPTLTIDILRRPHRGAAAARNSGAACAAGDILMFLDADDRWVSDKCRSQVDEIAHEPASAHVGWMQEFLDPDTDWSSAPAPEVRLLTGPSVCTLALRRDVFEEVGSFREDLRSGEGIEWFLRTRRAGVDLRSCDRILAERRIHSENRARAARSESADYLRVLREHLADGRT